MNRRDEFKRAVQKLKAFWWSELSRSMRRLHKRRARHELKQELKNEQAK